MAIAAGWKKVSPQDFVPASRVRIAGYISGKVIEGTAYTRPFRYGDKLWCIHLIKSRADTEVPCIMFKADGLEIPA